MRRPTAPALLPRIGSALRARGVRLLCDGPALAILAGSGVAAEAAAPADFRAEFLALTLAVRVVPSLEEAIAAVNRDGSAHSDAIDTADRAAADTFLAGVDSAVVLWNASTRFNDGFEFGFGAEIGISTDRLHARGPMGLRELCSYKWLVTGSGQVR
jgi:glutamate-5-semialdehyde dehydrogenase